MTQDEIIRMALDALVLAREDVSSALSSAKEMAAMSNRYRENVAELEQQLTNHDKAIEALRQAISEATVKDSLITEQVETKLRMERTILLNAVMNTIEENGHLADGDNCTLIQLKRAVEQVTGEKL